jgi:hypothetical protein
MDLEVIDTIFTFGKFIALTPSSMTNHNPHCLQKFYDICVYLLFVVGFSASIYAKLPLYPNLMPIEFVLAILYDLNQFSYVFYTLIVMMRLRRSRWFRLIKSLAAVKSAKDYSTQVNFRSVTNGLLLFDNFRSLRQRMVYRSH